MNLKNNYTNLNSLHRLFAAKDASLLTRGSYLQKVFFFPPSLRVKSWCCTIGLLACAAIALGLVAGEAQAQTQCSDSGLTTQTPIDTTEPPESTNNLETDLNGVKITVDETSGVHLNHQGPGNTKITIKDSCIETTGAATLNNRMAHHASGVLGVSLTHLNPMPNVGDITIDVQNSTIVTTGAEATGIAGQHDNEGNVQINVSNSIIETQGERASGIWGGAKYGDVKVSATNVNVTTNGLRARGIYAQNRVGDGDVTITVRGGEIITNNADTDSTINTSRSSYGIEGTHSGSGSLTIIARDGFRVETMGSFARGIVGDRIKSFNAGDGLTIDLENGEITTWGAVGSAVYGYQREGPGSIKIKLRNVVIRTEGTEIYANIGTLAYGVAAYHQGSGDIDVSLHGGSIFTRGSFSYGIDARKLNTVSGGAIRIMTENTSITTMGDSAYGIFVRHLGTDANRPIFVDVGGDVTASGMDAHGIKIGIVTSEEVSGVADLDDEGYRKQVVKVNSQVYGGSGESAGVWLAGGGRVFIGPLGKVGAQSGIAVHATGDSGVLKPKLFIHLMTGSLRMEDILGENWIINDGGGTTIVVNGTVLHDAATGATELWAPYGARDVTLHEEGVTIDNRTDPDPNNWVFSATTAAADRDFSAADFITGAYGPRAAVYEALPSAILQMDGRGGLARERLHSKESPLWIRLVGGTGSYEAEHATVGANYNFDRFEVEAGMDFQLSEGLTGSAGVRLVTGSADVSAPTRGGRITAEGYGMSFNLAREGANGFYGEGRAVATLYNTNLSSETRGQLKNNVDAIAHALNIEAGRRFALTERTLLTARAWVNQTGVSIDRFTDRFGTRVTSTDKDRLNAGIGGIFETDLPWDNSTGKLSLRGALGVEQLFSDGEADVLVSGENLNSKASDDTRLLLDLGMTYRQDRYTLRGAIQAHGLGSKANEYAARIELRTAF